jgi:putative DNA methylase
MKYKKKLIEVALPLEAINAASSREKSIRHGHPSTLHLWWSRKPTATARAVIWASLVDDPSSHPDEFPTEEAQNKERQRLFSILERLVKWKNSNNEEVLAEAKNEIIKSTNVNPPALLDPFAGGGSIPLEAQRLGLEAHASDLNPVAVMINKAMIEIPPKFAGQSPVNPEARQNPFKTNWKGTEGLAEDVRYYGEWMRQKAFERIGHLYPKVKDEHGQEHTVIAWIWARTVKCPNPACGCKIPLVSSFVLSKSNGKEAYVQPIIEGNKISYKVKYGKNAPKSSKTARGKFKCICCNDIATADYIDNEAANKRMSSVPIAVVVESRSGRYFLSIDPEQMHNLHDLVSAYYTDNGIDDIVPHGKTRGTFASNAQGRYYGFYEYKDYFTQRQLIALTTFSALVTEAKTQIINDGGCEEYAHAVAVYLAFGVDRACNYWSTLNTWGGEFIVQAFARQGIAMMWDYAESNPFSSSTGCWLGAIDWIVRAINNFPAGGSDKSNAFQNDAQSDNGFRNVMISTDPPYYDNITYSDLSDYFYVWLRHSLKNIYPELFRTMLVPKSEELIASPYRFDGSMEKAKHFFEHGMLQAFKQIYLYSREDLPITVYYAYMQKETDDDDNTSSSGWETMLSAIVVAGFTITGTWPIRTERSGGFRNHEQNALASSIVLVCRKRPADAPICTRRDFINTLKRELKPALKKLQQSNIAPVDLAQSAIGPGMGVYSRFSKVLEADGTPMSVRSALQIINQELDLYLSAQDGELDRDSRFCVDLYTQYAFNDVKFGEADVLARAKNTSVEKLAARSVLYAQKGVVRLLTREEIPQKVDREILWLLTQQLTRALEKDGVLGVAKIVSGIFTSEPEQAKALAYRLFQIAERKGWAQEAYAYNSLVIAWPEVQSKAAELQAQMRNATQMTLFDTGND